MTWIWLNIPLAALFFLAVPGIPLWMVLKRQDAGPRALTPDRPPRPSATGHRASHAAGLARPPATASAAVSVSASGECPGG